MEQEGSILLNNEIHQSKADDPFKALTSQFGKKEESGPKIDNRAVYMWDKHDSLDEDKTVVQCLLKAAHDRVDGTESYR